MFCRRHRQKKTSNTSTILSRLAQTEKMAKDTFNRTRARMPPSNISANANSNNWQSTHSCHNNSAYDCGLITSSQEHCSSSRSRSSREQLCYYQPEEPCNNDRRSQNSCGFTSMPQKCADGRVSSSSTKSLQMFTYYMGRISFQCEAHLNGLLPCEMTHEDMLHRQRFHSGSSY